MLHLQKKNKTLKTRFGWLTWGVPPKTRFGGGVAWEVVPRPNQTNLFLYIFLPYQTYIFYIFLSPHQTHLFYIFSAPIKHISFYIFSLPHQTHLFYIFSRPHQTHIFSTTYLYHTYFFYITQTYNNRTSYTGGMVFKVITRGGVKNRRTHRVPCY